MWVNVGDCTEINCTSQIHHVFMTIHEIFKELFPSLHVKKEVENAWHQQRDDWRSTPDKITPPALHKPIFAFPYNWQEWKSLIAPLKKSHDIINRTPILWLVQQYATKQTRKRKEALTCQDPIDVHWKLFWPISRNLNTSWVFTKEPLFQNFVWNTILSTNFFFKSLYFYRDLRLR